MYTQIVIFGFNLFRHSFGIAFHFLQHIAFALANEVPLATQSSRVFIHSKNIVHAYEIAKLRVRKQTDDEGSISETIECGLCR